MKKQLSLIFALALAFGAPAGLTSNAQQWGFTAQAQTGKVSGVVRDANGEPLIGATVKVKGTNRGTATDIDGKYSIAADPGSTLVITFVGSKPMEVKVTGSTQDITLSDDSQMLGDVVVTAMGVKRERKALGYAVDDLKADDILDTCADWNIAAGVKIDDNTLMLAVTEQRTREEMDDLVNIIKRLKEDKA